MTKPTALDSLEQVAGNGLLHRRLFLQGGAGALAGATLLTARAAPPEVPASMKTPGTPMRAYGERSPHEARVQRTVGATTGRGGHRQLAHAARVARRHHHAELAALRAPP